jgi:hypothetical protein
MPPTGNPARCSPRTLDELDAGERGQLVHQLVLERRVTGF